jgi:hypothetical protein
VGAKDTFSAAPPLAIRRAGTSFEIISSSVLLFVSRHIAENPSQLMPYEHLPNELILQIAAVGPRIPMESERLYPDGKRTHALLQPLLNSRLPNCVDPEALDAMENYLRKLLSAAEGLQKVGRGGECFVKLAFAMQKNTGQGGFDRMVRDAKIGYILELPDVITMLGDRGLRDYLVQAASEMLTKAAEERKGKVASGVI